MAKAGSKKYVARYEGEIVGKRRSDRTYQFAVVVQDDEAKARDYAYNYAGSELDHANHAYHLKVVAVGVGGVWDTGRGFTYLVDQQQFDGCKADLEGGFDGYVARRREREIARFEESLAKGGYLPHVAGWCGRRDLADKLAAQQRQYRAVLAIVPAELV